MDENEELAERFEQHRPRLRAVAYRMLGSPADADDAVQHAWLRLSRSDAEQIDNLGRWLTTVVARECLHLLRSRRRRREDPLAPHLPDLVAVPDGDLVPEQQALLGDSVSLALLIVLDQLTPAERLVFVLHDMFELPFEEIASIAGRTPGRRTATRQPGTAPRGRCQSPITRSGSSAPAAGRPRVLRGRVDRRLRRPRPGPRPRPRRARRLRRPQRDGVSRTVNAVDNDLRVRSP